MNSNICFQPNSPHVIHEIIGGEAILLSLESGDYYSIDHVGATIWAQLEKQLTVNQIIEAVSMEYEGTATEIENGVGQLLEQLHQERLIIPSQNGQSQINSAPTVSANIKTKSQFIMPLLQKYTDMEDLLLLDPIHDVSETGWPVRKSDKVEESH